MGKFFIRFHFSISEVSKEISEIRKQNSNNKISSSYVVLDAWYQCFKKSSRQYIISLWCDDVCIGISPMLLDKKYGLNRIYSLYHGDSCFSLGTPLIMEGYEEAFYKNFFRLIFQSKVKWNVIKFSNIYNFEADHALLREIAAIERSVSLILSKPTYCVDMAGGLAAYHENYLSANSRKAYKRRLNKLKESAEYKFLCLRAHEALPFVESFLALENMGWKGKAGTSLLKSQDELIFFDCMVNELCKENKFMLFILQVDGVTVAGQCGFIEGDIFNMMKSAYDENFNHLSPSTLLFMNMLEFFYAEQRGVTKLHAYPISYGYKNNYMHGNDYCSTFIFFNKTLFSRGLFRLYKFKMRNSPELVKFA